MSAADDLRALLAMEGGRETLKARSRWMEEHGASWLALLDAAQVTSREIQTDLPIKCLICAERGGDHVDGCPVEALAVAVAALTEPRA